MLGEKEIGKIVRYFDKPQVAVVEVSSEIALGDMIHIRGVTTDFSQNVESMQIEHKNIEKAKKGEMVGLKVDERVRINDRVYLIKN